MKKNGAVSGPPAGEETHAEVSPDEAWDDIRRRLNACRSALEVQFEPSAEDKRRILQERALELARPPREETGADTRLEVVEFLLAGERYGIEPDHVREIFPLKTLTPVPGAPAFVLGVTNLRGAILSVIDLKKFFDLPDEGLTDLTKVIVLQSDAMEFGILADAVVGSRSISKEDIQPPLPTFSDIREKYLKGVTEGRLAILDAERILCDEAIVVHQEVQSKTP